MAKAKSNPAPAAIALAPVAVQSGDDEAGARRSGVTRGEAHPARAAEEVIVRARRVACDGVGGALGHPRVWLELGGDNLVECPYCDRRFVLAIEHAGEDELRAPGVYEGSHGH
jgi:uncharacterized Zn-finger protein